MKTPTAEEIRIAEKVIDIIHTLGTEDDFGYRAFYRWKNQNAGNLAENDIRLSYGETKICFISDKLTNWVIKMDYSDNDGECDLEYQNYVSACKENLDRYFAAMFKLGNGFYLQERAHVSEDENTAELELYASNYMDKDPDQTEDDYRESISCEVEDMNDPERIRGFLGETCEAEEVITFCNNYSINDLHPGNWGLADRGYIIIDYSGFH